jgi:DNA-binding response OmpR family regulator
MRVWGKGHRNKEETRTLPVIMLSARAGEEASSAGLDEGADDYLTKPFTTRELLFRVASHLKMSRMRLEAAKAEQELRIQVERPSHSPSVVHRECERVACCMHAVPHDMCSGRVGGVRSRVGL